MNYESYVEKARTLNTGAAKVLTNATLHWYWQMGELVSGLRQDHPGVPMEQFVADAHIERGLSTIYHACKIFTKYKPEEITDLADKGVTVGHLKLIMPLEESKAEEATNSLTKEDGSVISVKELAEQIKQTKTASPAASTDDTPAAASSSSSGASAAASDFSVSPVKALKAIDSALIKVIANAGEAIIAVNEAVKVGFDSDKARKNFVTACSNAEASLEDILKTAPDLLAQIKEAKQNV